MAQGYRLPFDYQCSASTRVAFLSLLASCVAEQYESEADIVEGHSFATCAGAVAVTIGEVAHFKAQPAAPIDREEWTAGELTHALVMEAASAALLITAEAGAAGEVLIRALVQQAAARASREAAAQSKDGAS